MKLEYKKCGLSDLDVLQKISSSTFEAAFAKDNKPEHINNYLEKAFSRKQVKRELSNPKSLFYFVRQEEVVGYLKLNLQGAQTDINGLDSIELERIYVLAKHQSRGYGQEMLMKAIEIGMSLNLSYMWLGVWDQNDGAIRFYERHGFKKFAEHPFYMGNELQTDFLMKLNLRD